jgi:hypothetical protein
VDTGAKKGISVCVAGCARSGGKRTKPGPVNKCEEGFSPARGGKRCNGACFPGGEGYGKMTFDAAKAFCESLKMKLPGNSDEVQLAKGTGCNLDRKQIWMDKSA